MLSTSPCIDRRSRRFAMHRDTGPLNRMTAKSPPPSPAKQNASTRRRSRESSVVGGSDALTMIVSTMSPSLADQAYIQLREALMAGRYEPGEAIVVQALADEFGTSVMPVREAVGRLGTERALEMVSGRSARVPDLLQGERFIELCEVRMLLEGEAAALAAKRATEEDLREIERCHLKMQAAVRKHDTDEALRCNREFHFAIYRSAHQELLSQTIETLWLQCGPYFRAVFTAITKPEGQRRKSTLHHHDALTALRARKARQAAAAIVADIEESTSWYRQAHRDDARSATSNATSRKRQRSKTPTVPPRTG